ncbi:hypothetical protein AB0E63_26820 [Kribbella sp. NPDC026596]|uniref:hypothetical protein n=1 Tax=Kribbella sp. NPDC026596 TaxID=3155122 RepID=UPI0033CF5A7D
MNTQLTDLMHRATENLEPVTPDLLERSVQQGLRLRRRRTTVLSLTGAGAILATVGLIAGGVQLLGSPSNTAVASTPIPLAKPTPAAKPSHVTPQQTLERLKSFVKAPGRTLSQPETWGTSEEGFAAAAYVVNDGKGASRVDVLVAGGGVQGLCESSAANCTTNPDGSKLFSVTEQPEYPGDRNKDGVTSNHVEISYPDGRFISMTSYNAPAEKGQRHTRQKPLFTVAELTTMAKSKTWKFPPANVVKPSGKVVPPSSKIKPTK